MSTLEIRCRRQDLVLALQAADAVVPANSAKPILTNLLLDARNGGLEVAATDLQVGLAAVVSQVEVDREGQVVVPARQMVSILKESRSPSATLFLIQDNERSQLAIELADGSYRIPAVVGEVFPQVAPFPVDAPTLRLPAEALERMIRRSAFAADKERSSAVLSGILLSAEGNSVMLAATDGKVLGECRSTSTSNGSSDEPLQAIIPAATINHCARILSAGAINDVELAVVGKLVFLRATIGAEDSAAVSIAVELTSRLIDGTYPPYRNALPSSPQAVARFRTAELASAVRRTALMTNSSSRGLILELSPGNAQLSNLFTNSGSAHIPLACDYEGGIQRFGLNANYLADVLKVLDGEEVGLELHGPGKGITIHDGDGTYLVMPITLST